MNFSSPWFKNSWLKTRGWKVHGWKVWGWKFRGWNLGLKSPGLRCPLTLPDIEPTRNWPNSCTAGTHHNAITTWCLLSEREFRRWFPYKNSTPCNSVFLIIQLFQAIRWIGPEFAISKGAKAFLFTSISVCQATSIYYNYNKLYYR